MPGSFVVSLGLLVLVLGLLVLPGPYHRIVEHGADSNRLHALATRVADVSLLPFALALAIVVFIVGERIAGTTTGVVAGAGAASIALALWYGLPWLRSRSLRRQLLDLDMHGRFLPLRRGLFGHALPQSF